MHKNIPTLGKKTQLCLEGKLPGGEVNVLLVLLLGDEVGLLVGETAADGAGLFVAEVEGEVWESALLD
jgi:hypothetical protein